MKQCSYENCSNTVYDWQNFCDMHYDQLKKQQEQKVEKPRTMEAPPEMPPVREHNITPTTPQIKRPVRVEEPEEENIHDIEVKKIAFQGAINVINILVQNNPKQFKDIAQMVDEVESLTENFSNIITGE